MDLCCICWTKVSSKYSGHHLPHTTMRAAAAAAGCCPRSPSPLSRWTDYEIQFSFMSNGVITEPVFI